MPSQTSGGETPRANALPTPEGAREPLFTKVDTRMAVLRLRFYSLNANKDLSSPRTLLFISTAALGGIGYTVSATLKAN